MSIKLLCKSSQKKFKQVKEASEAIVEGQLDFVVSAVPRPHERLRSSPDRSVWKSRLVASTTVHHFSRHFRSPNICLEQYTQRQRNRAALSQRRNDFDNPIQPSIVCPFIEESH